MATRRTAPKLTGKASLGKYVPHLLGVLSLLTSIWASQRSSFESTARESGQMLQFKEQASKTDDTFREALRRQADRLTVHMQESEAEHRELRRDLETEYRRDIDASCNCKPEHKR